MTKMLHSGVPSYSKCLYVIISLEAYTSEGKNESRRDGTAVWQILFYALTVNQI